MTRQTTVTPSLSLGRDCMHCGTALSGVKLNNHEYRTLKEYSIRDGKEPNQRMLTLHFSKVSLHVRIDGCWASLFWTSGPWHGYFPKRWSNTEGGLKNDNFFRNFHIERAPVVHRKLVLKYKEAPNQLSLWRSLAERFGAKQNIQSSAYRNNLGKLWENIRGIHKGCMKLKFVTCLLDPELSLSVICQS